MILKKRKARRFKPREESASSDGAGFGYQVPPKLQWVQVYFDQKRCSDLADIFYQEFMEKQWQTVRRKKIRNWKTLAADWIFDHQQEVKLKLKKSRFM